MTILALLFAFLLGLMLLYAFHPKAKLMELIGFSFPIGIGTITLLMFALDVLGLKINVLNTSISIVSACIGIGVYVFFVHKEQLTQISAKRFELNASIKDLNVVWLGCAAIIVFVLYGISKKSLFWPTFATDALTSFNLYAKAIAREGTLQNSLVLNQHVGGGAAYPPLYSLSLAYAMMFGFKLTKIIPVLFFISLTVGFYALVKQNTNSTNAILFTLVMITVPEMLAQSAINITSVPQSAYGALGVIAFFTWLSNKENGYLILSGVLLAFNGWIRSEGIVFITVVFLLLSYDTLKTRDYKKLAVFTVLSIAPFLIWQLYLRLNHELMDPFLQVEIIKMPLFDGEKLSKIVGISKYNLLSETYYGLVIYGFLLVVVLNVKFIIKNLDNVGLILAIALIIVFYLGLINQLQLRYDSVDNILKYSAKRFFFGPIIVMCFYLSNNALMKKAFEYIHNQLRYPLKPAADS